MRENAPKEEVQRLLHKHRIEKVLVVNGDDELKGMITVKDFQKATEFPRASKDESGRLRVGAAIGTTPDTLDRVVALREAGVDVIVLDTSHGHSRGVLEMIARLKSRWSDLELIAGNIVTREAALDLVGAGADAVKVGIGPGSICTTRVVAGVGVPQITAVANVAAALEGRGVPMIADGGIRYSGDLAKAIAAGAHAVMIGGMFAGTEESPGRGRALPGRLLQGVSRHGLARRDVGAPWVGRSLFPGHRHRAREAGARGHRGPRALQGQPGQRSCTSSPAACAPPWATPAATTSSRCARGRAFVRITTAGVRESHVHDVTITKEAPNYRVS